MTTSPQTVPAPPEALRDRPVRFAAIGTGGMGGAHARWLADNPNAELAWAVDLDLPRAEAIVADVGGRATAEMDEALADPGVDAVLIALPTSLHRMATEAAARAGKHVFCEKPIARTAEDGRAMAAACREAGVTLMIGHVVRFYPEFASVKEILDAGMLGRIAMARTFRVAPPVQEHRPWFADVEQSGGVVLDLMVHDLDTLAWYFGPVERLFAHGLTYTEHQPKRDFAVATLRFRNGVIAHIEVSWAHAAFRTGIEVAGQYGLLRHASEDGATLTLERTTAVDETLERPARFRMRPSRQPPHQAEVQHFIESLRSGEPVLTDGEAGIRAITLANAVLDSMRTRQPVHFNEDGSVRNG